MHELPPWIGVCQLQTVYDRFAAMRPPSLPSNTTKTLPIVQVLVSTVPVGLRGHTQRDRYDISKSWH